MNVDEYNPRTPKKTRIASFFDVAGGISSIGLVLVGIILLLAASTTTGSDTIIQVVLALGFICFGAITGFSKNLRKTRIVTGVLFVILFVAFVVAAQLIVIR